MRGPLQGLDWKFFCCASWYRLCLQMVQGLETQLNRLWGWGAQATTAYEDARDKVARLINARSAREVVFTSNATAGINLVAQSWGNLHLRPGDEVRAGLLSGACTSTVRKTCHKCRSIVNPVSGLKDLFDDRVVT